MQSNILNKYHTIYFMFHLTGKKKKKSEINSQLSLRRKNISADVLLINEVIN